MKKKRYISRKRRNYFNIKNYSLSGIEKDKFINDENRIIFSVKNKRDKTITFYEQENRKEKNKYRMIWRQKYKRKDGTTFTEKQLRKRFYDDNKGRFYTRLPYGKERGFNHNLSVRSTQNIQIKVAMQGTLRRNGKIAYVIASSDIGNRGSDKQKLKEQAYERGLRLIQFKLTHKSGGSLDNIRYEVLLVKMIVYKRKE